jgi:hypothetical protein
MPLLCSDSLTAPATASSKKLEAPIRAQDAATLNEARHVMSRHGRREDAEQRDQQHGSQQDHEEMFKEYLPQKLTHWNCYNKNCRQFYLAIVRDGR